MKTIIATGGYHLTVDPIDYERLTRDVWYVNKKGHAIKSGGTPMYAIVLGLEYQDIKKLTVTHLNGDKLDNRKQNLVVGGSALPINLSTVSTHVSRHYDRGTTLYHAQLKVGSKLIDLGLYPRPQEAYLSCFCARKQVF